MGTLQHKLDKKTSISHKVNNLIDNDPPKDFFLYFISKRLVLKNSYNSTQNNKRAHKKPREKDKEVKSGSEGTTLLNIQLIQMAHLLIKKSCYVTSLDGSEL